MVSIPNVRNDPGAFRGGTNLPRVSEGPGQVSQALQGTGQAFTELGNRMFQDAVAQQQAELELEAEKRLTRLHEQAITSKDFRQAPEQFKEQAKQEVQNIVSEANPAIQDQLRVNLAGMASSMTADLRRETARKSQAAAIASFETKAGQEVQNFATADDPEERQQALDRVKDLSKRIVRSGAEVPEQVKQRLTQVRQQSHIQRAAYLRSQNRLDEAKQWVQDSDQIAQDQKRILLDAGVHGTAGGYPRIATSVRRRPASARWARSTQAGFGSSRGLLWDSGVAAP